MKTLKSGIKVLNEKDREEVIEALRNYKEVYCCRKCARIYGSDMVTDNGYCPACENRDKGEKEDV